MAARVDSLPRRDPPLPPRAAPAGPGPRTARGSPRRRSRRSGLRTSIRECSRISSVARAPDGHARRSVVGSLARRAMIPSSKRSRARPRRHVQGKLDDLRADRRLVTLDPAKRPGGREHGDPRCGHSRSWRTSSGQKPPALYAQESVPGGLGAVQAEEPSTLFATAAGPPEGHGPRVPRRAAPRVLPP